MMDLLAAHFVVLPLSEAVALLKARKLPRRAVCITFDYRLDSDAERAQAANAIISSLKYLPPAARASSTAAITARAGLPEDMAREAGFDAAFSTVWGTPEHGCDLFQLPRVNGDAKPRDFGGETRIGESDAGIGATVGAGSATDSARLRAAGRRSECWLSRVGKRARAGGHG